MIPCEPMSHNWIWNNTQQIEECNVLNFKTDNSELNNKKQTRWSELFVQKERWGKEHRQKYPESVCLPAVNKVVMQSLSVPKRLATYKVTHTSTRSQGHKK